VKLRLDSNNDLTRFKHSRPMRTYNLAYSASLVHSSSQQGREAHSPLCHCCNLQFYKTTLQNLVWLKFVVYCLSEYERRMSGRFMDIMHSLDHRNLF